jgi:hypothetical protein
LICPLAAGFGAWRQEGAGFFRIGEKREWNLYE